MQKLVSRSSPWMIFFVGSLIAWAGWAAYFNSFHGPFIFDDENSIPNNPTIEHLGQLRTVLSPPGDGRTVSGRPILNLSFAINRALSGTEVRGYHITNLVIHLLNGLLLLEILRRTFLLPALQPKFGPAALPLAGAIALLWIVHPLTTEAVTYTVQRAESLASLFYLLVLYAVIRGSQGRAALWFGLAVAACWLGVATKEIVATAPVMALLYDRTLLAGTFRQAWQRRWGLYLGLAASWGLLIGLIFQRGFVTKVITPDLPDVWSYACSQPGVILHYLRQTVWPYPLCLDWAWPAAKTGSAIYGPMLIVGLLLAATIWALLRSNAGGLLGAWFFLILAPSSSIVPLLQLACEHRMYLPLAAIITLLVVSVYLGGKAASQKWMVRDWGTVGLCLVILLAAVLGNLTFHRNQDYHHASAIWENTAKWAPHNPTAQINWGAALLKQEHLPEAGEHFEKALQIQPDHALAHNDLGYVLLALGRPAEAIGHLQQAVQLRPNNASFGYTLSRCLLALGRPQEAITYCQKTLELQPDYAEAHFTWGMALLTMGKPVEAIEQFEHALQIEPRYAEARNNLGMALAKLGRWPAAIEQYQQFLQITPDSALGHLNLALALAHAGRIDEAREHGRQAMRLVPDNPQINRQVAWLLATHEASEKGVAAEAVKLARRACDLIQRKDIVYLDTLAVAYASADRFDEAIATAQEAWQLAQAAGQNAAAEVIFQRLQLYHNRKPYREP